MEANFQAPPGRGKIIEKPLVLRQKAALESHRSVSLCAPLLSMAAEGTVGVKTEPGLLPDNAAELRAQLLVLQERLAAATLSAKAEPQDEIVAASTATATVPALPPALPPDCFWDTPASGSYHVALPAPALAPASPEATGPAGEAPPAPALAPEPPASAVATASTGALSDEPLEDIQKRTLLALNPEKAAARPIKLPKGITVAQFATSQDRAKAWGKYMRSLQVDGSSKADITDDRSRSKRTEKASERIMSQIAGIHEKTFYFNIWCANDGSWAQVEGWEEHYYERTYGTKKTLAWMMDSQMLEVWKDRDIVDALQQICNLEHTPQHPQVRPHPKLKHLWKARQFLVEIEDHMVESVTNVMKGGVRMAFRLEGEEGKAIALNHVGQSRAHFGGSNMAEAAPAQVVQAPAHTPVVAGGASELAAAPIANAGEGTAPTSGTGNSSNANLAPEERLEREDAQRAQRLERFREQEEQRAQRTRERAERAARAAEDRRITREKVKEDRKAEAQTPQGRARIWLHGLDAHIRSSRDEAAHCKSAKCILPKGLKQEYATSWTSKASSFKRARTNIDKLLNGEALPANFSKIVDKAELDIKDFKADMQRYRTLERGYLKSKEKRQKTETADEAEAAAETGDVF